MAIKLIVLDIDGTLLHTGEQIADATITQLRALAADGWQLALASARPTPSIRVLRERIGVPMHVIGDNGAHVETADGTLVRQVTFEVSPELATALSRFVHAGDAAINVYTDEGRWLAFGAGARIDREAHDTWTEPDTRAATLAADELVGVQSSKMMCEGADISGVQRAVEAIDGLHLTHSGNGLNDIWHEHSGKGNGLAALAGALGLEMDEVLSVGDSDTDVPMLALAGASIAVQPAAAKALAAAQFSARGAGSDEVFATIRRVCRQRVEE